MATPRILPQTIFFCRVGNVRRSVATAGFIPPSSSKTGVRFSAGSLRTIFATNRAPREKDEVEWKLQQFGVRSLPPPLKSRRSDRSISERARAEH